MENHPNDDNNPGGTRKRKTKSELGEGTHECNLCKKNIIHIRLYIPIVGIIIK